MSDESEVVSRNPYVAKLGEFSEIALAGPRIGVRKGQWRSFFKSRMAVEPRGLILEVGCSNGYYLNDIAKDHASTAFLGLDWKYKLIYKACSKTKKLDLKNTAFIRGRGQDLLQIFAPGELSEIWVFFPDPWPKAAQQKHRLLQEKFFLDAAALLPEKGRIQIKTDHPGYFEWILAILGIKADPQSFEASEKDVPSERSKRSRQFLHRTYDNKDLPPRSAAVNERFEVVRYSFNFWHDPSIGASESARADDPLIWGRTTLFEGLFRKDNLPVYYLELKRRG